MFVLQQSRTHGRWRVNMNRGSIFIPRPFGHHSSGCAAVRFTQTVWTPATPAAATTGTLIDTPPVQLPWTVSVPTAEPGGAA